MSNEEEIFVGGRLVSDLKVVELRKELEVRSLPKSGNKKELIERLENFLREELAEQQRQKQQHQTPQKPEQPMVQQAESPSASVSHLERKGGVVDLENQTF